MDDEHFFLAINGKFDPHAELLATLSAFKSTNELSIDSRAQCRFPARFYWLSEKIPELRQYKLSCPEFDTWQATLSPEKIYLVFPAAYLNSPSSMYGHTLFRVKKSGSTNALLDYAVNYAANPDPNDNQLVFSYKGLAGKYPGVFSVMPYYQKVQEYGALESRDIWEYELDLKPEEVSQMVRHIWEMKNSYMDYYFFTENCAYQLLSMLDASSDRISLIHHFSFRAIPTDTIRVLGRAGLIKSTQYRPSTLTEMASLQSNLAQSEIELAKRLVEEQIFKPELLGRYLVAEQAKILDLAYQYSRYLAAKKKSKIPHLGARSIKLLSARSKLSIKEDESTVVPIPKYRDDQGHATQRVEIELGKHVQDEYLGINYRPAYHDLLDLPEGYITNSKLEMFSFGARRYRQGEIKLQNFSFIDIRSLTPVSGLLSSNSWQVKFGFERKSILANYPMFNLAAGYGRSYNLALGQLTFMLNLDTYTHKRLDKGYFVGAGPHINYLYQGSAFSLLAEYSKVFNEQGATKYLTTYNLELAYHLNKEWQLRLNGKSEQASRVSSDTVAIALVHYF